MAVWDWIYSATDAVKQKTPDITPATEVCRKSYTFCRDSTVHVAGAATTKARELHEYMSDDEVRDNLSRFAVNISKNSALYIARSYGVGPVIDIVSRSVQGKKTDAHNGRIEELENKVAKLEKELNSRIIPQHSEIPRTMTAMKSQDEPKFSSIVNERPEDVLKIFMMEQFVATKLFNNLTVLKDVGSKSKVKPVSSTDGQCE